LILRQIYISSSINQWGSTGVHCSSDARSRDRSCLKIIFWGFDLEISGLGFAASDLGLRLGLAASDLVLHVGLAASDLGLCLGLAASDLGLCLSLAAFDLGLCLGLAAFDLGLCLGVAASGRGHVFM